MTTTKETMNDAVAVLSALIRYVEALDEAIEASRNGELPCDHGTCALESARITLFDCLKKSGVSFECHHIHGTIQ